MQFVGKAFLISSGGTLPNLCLIKDDRLFLIHLQKLL